MEVVLERGTFGAVDGFAISDFELLSTGDVDDLNVAVTVNGGCLWEATAFGAR